MLSKLKASHLIQGEKSELIAYHYLIDQGLQAVDKNFRCKYGELDLIMRENKTLVIIEVRFRKSKAYGGALESITKKKQSRIIAATEYYLHFNKINSLIRFDVIAMSSDTDIQWIKNAFQT